MWKQLPNLPKQVSDGELKASGPSGPHFLVMGHHAGPMGITPIQLTSCFESTASVRSLLLLLVMVVWPYVYLNYWQQAFIDLRSTEDKDDEHAALFGHDFHDFLLCFMRGVPKSLTGVAQLSS